MGQIYTEYERTLRAYERAIDELIYRARMERARIDKCITEGHRLQQSHDILHSAWVIIETDAKLKVFSNLGFTKEM